MGLDQIVMFVFWVLFFVLALGYVVFRMVTGHSFKGAFVEQAVNALEARITPSNATPEVTKQLAHGNEVLGKTEQALKWATAAHEKSPEWAKAQELVIALQRKANTHSHNLQVQELKEQAQ